LASVGAAAASAGFLAPTGFFFVRSVGLGPVVFRGFLAGEAVALGGVLLTAAADARAAATRFTVEAGVAVLGAGFFVAAAAGLGGAAVAEAGLGAVRVTAGFGGPAGLGAAVVDELGAGLADGTRGAGAARVAGAGFFSPLVLV